MSVDPHLGHGSEHGEQIAAVSTAWAAWTSVVSGFVFGFIVLDVLWFLFGGACALSVRIIGLATFRPRFRALPAKPESRDCTESAKSGIKDRKERTP